jgi:hypothetical protein
MFCHLDVDLFRGQAGFFGEETGNLGRGSAFDTQPAKRAQVDSAIGIDGVPAVRRVGRVCEAHL